MVRTILTIRVNGHPRTQGSMTSIGNGRMKHSPELVTWRQLVTDMVTMKARTNRPSWKPVDEPVGCAIEFILPRPQKPRWEVPGTDLDIDKLERAIFDALAPKQNRRTLRHALLQDDSRICESHKVKRYAADGEQPGANVSVWTLA